MLYYEHKVPIAYSDFDVFSSQSRVESVPTRKLAKCSSCFVSRGVHSKSSMSGPIQTSPRNGSFANGNISKILCRAGCLERIASIGSTILPSGCCLAKEESTTTTTTTARSRDGKPFAPLEALLIPATRSKVWIDRAHDLASKLTTDDDKRTCNT
jgi:hypothetical protein